MLYILHHLWVLEWFNSVWIVGAHDIFDPIPLLVYCLYVMCGLPRGHFLYKVELKYVDVSLHIDTGNQSGPQGEVGWGTWGMQEGRVLAMTKILAIPTDYTGQLMGTKIHLDISVQAMSPQQDSIVFGNLPISQTRNLYSLLDGLCFPFLMSVGLRFET